MKKNSLNKTLSKWMKLDTKFYLTASVISLVFCFIFNRIEFFVMGM